MTRTRIIASATVALTLLTPSASPQVTAHSQAGCFACISSGSATPRYNGTPPRVLYRVDTRPPVTNYGTGIFETGFAPIGEGLDLVRHVIREEEALPSGYVATTDSPETALTLADGLFSHDPNLTLSSVWIYVIRATDSFHNVEQSLEAMLDRTPVESADRETMELAHYFAVRQREWVTAETVPPSQIQRAHEVNRRTTEYNPDSPDAHINDAYRRGFTRASCRLI